MEANLKKAKSVFRGVEESIALTSFLVFDSLHCRYVLDGSQASSQRLLRGKLRGTLKLTTVKEVWIPGLN